MQVPGAGVLHVREGDRQGGRVRVGRRPAGAPIRPEVHQQRRVVTQGPRESRHVGKSAVRSCISCLWQFICDAEEGVTTALS
jgi:hypothetical protein